jgi:succinyl-CoA synthetase beta subunit
VIVRLQGTNAAEAKKIIDDSGLKIFSAVSFKDAADRVSSVLKAG